MSELQLIRSALEQAARRRRWARALRGMWYGLLVGAIMSLLILGVYHLFPVPLWTLVVAGALPVPCMLMGLILGGWRKIPLPEVARWVDDRQRLKERLSTALELSDNAQSGAWRDLVMADAAVHARDLDARQLLPFRLPRVTRWALVILALGAGLGFVPEYRSKAYLDRKAEQENIKEVGRQLAELTRRSLKQRPPALEQTEKSLETVAALGDQFAKQTLTRSDALKDLASVTEKLKDQMKDLAKDPALRRLEQSARSGSSSDSQTPAGLQKQIESLQKQLGTPTGNPDEMEKLKNQLEKLQEAAKGMADQNSSTGTDAERQKLSDSLTALSRQAQDLGLQIPELDAALEALAANQTELFLKNLDQALRDLEKTRDMAKTLQQLQQQAEKLGKDLAEQLKNGQPEAAQMTLQKLASELKEARLSPEQLDKIMQEVSKAVDPAGHYENVAQHLKDAVKEMQQGQKAQASESLVAAAKELENLMQQMGDLQELADAMQALEQASMCIGSGQGWCRGQRPGWKPGGKPGSGVGTWAEEGGEWDGQWTDGWDNSDVERPDMDARGVSDRGPGEVSENLSPTKVKGQFSPGAQMPSITLKGVSIKGQSQVEFQEAATAAQSDAESALSQDKVPRAYQGTVKGYFDDFSDVKE